MKALIHENFEITNWVSEKTELSKGILAVVNMTGDEFRFIINCWLIEREQKIKEILDDKYLPWIS